MLKSDAQTRQLDVQSIKSDFPIFERTVHGKKLVYLDNAATTQKPRQVIDSLVDYYSKHNANIHRSVHELAEEATELFEASRDNIKRFINAPLREEIVFTKNATEALNIAASCTTENLVKGDKIVVTEFEHHSNFVPWQQIAKKNGAKLEIVDVDPEGRLDESDLDQKLADAKIFAFSHMSNVLGTITDAKRLTKLAHDHGATVVLDGAQSAPHIPIDVQDIGCDYFALSSHKMLGPTGVGVLFGKKQLLEKSRPFLYGGDMIKEVHREESRWNDLPWKYEAGTSNIADVIAFSKAIDYLAGLGMSNIARYEESICKAGLEELGRIDEIEIYGPKEAKSRGAVFSFNFGKIHAHDIASILDQEGVAIRSGHHCAQVLMEKLGIVAASRASFYLYNDLDDLEALCKGLKKVKEVLG
ncbi:MAG: cysteine desulfurase [Nitrososphaerales archaeon]